MQRILADKACKASECPQWLELTVCRSSQELFRLACANHATVSLSGTFIGHEYTCSASHAPGSGYAKALWNTTALELLSKLDTSELEDVVEIMTMSVTSKAAELGKCKGCAGTIQQRFQMLRRGWARLDFEVKF